jgi:hypothetical protein
MRGENWSWSSSSQGIPGEEGLAFQMSKRRSFREVPPREGLACWAQICFLLLVKEDWTVEWAQEQVYRDTPESNTPTVAPGSMAR